MGAGWQRYDFRDKCLQLGASQVDIFHGGVPREMGFRKEKEIISSSKYINPLSNESTQLRLRFTNQSTVVKITIIGNKTKQPLSI